MVTCVFVTFASGLFWLDFFRGYQGEVTVLIITKPGMAETSQAVTDNAIALTGTLTFYDRLLADNDLIDDTFFGYAPDTRKALWQKTVSVKRQAESGALVIRAQGETPEQAKRLAKQTTETLFAMMSFYYDVKQEVDMRIIDGPLVFYALDNWWLFSATSVLSGMALTGLFFWFLRVVPTMIGRRSQRSLMAVKQGSETTKTHPEFFPRESLIDPAKFIPTKPESLSFEHTLQPQSQSRQSTSLKKTHPVTHAPAPANLPIAEGNAGLAMMDAEDLSFTFEDSSQASSLEVEPPIPSSASHSLEFPVRGEHAIQTVPIVSDASPSVIAERLRAEPTVDEYKRRLNALLSEGQ